MSQTNREWLFSKPWEEQLAWLNAEHVEYGDAEFVVPLEEAMKFTTDPPAYVKEHIAELQAKVDRLTAERDELKFNISLVRKNRDKYRSKFGKCIDYADAIHALMDDEGMA